MYVGEVHPTPDRPGPGQESVWDYPRPPALVPSDALVEIVLGGVTIASTRRSLRVLETSHPPTFYVPVADFADGVLTPVGGSTSCEWKGSASYLDLVTPGRTARRAGWTYPTPTPAFEPLVDHVAVFPALVDRCVVDGEVVRPQAGGFYGGWVTDAVAGPFKGEPGTHGW